MPVRASLLVVGALTLLAPACGSGDEGSPRQARVPRTYAGMSVNEARLRARATVEREVASPESPLYRRPVRLVRLFRGRNTLGQAAWVAVVSGSASSERVCIRLWAAEVPYGRAYDGEVGSCARASSPPAARGQPV